MVFIKQLDQIQDLRRQFLVHASLAHDLDDGQRVCLGEGQVVKEFPLRCRQLDLALCPIPAFAGPDGHMGDGVGTAPHQEACPGVLALPDAQRQVVGARGAFDLHQVEVESDALLLEHVAVVRVLLFEDLFLIK